MEGKKVREGKGGEEIWREGRRDEMRIEEKKRKEKKRKECTG